MCTRGPRFSLGSETLVSRVTLTLSLAVDRHACGVLFRLVTMTMRDSTSSEEVDLVGN